MFAEAWKNELPESHLIALDIAYSDFIDSYFHISPTDAGNVDQISDWLPRRHRDRYSSLFCHRFIICMSSVAERLAQPELVTPIPRCTAEAIALHVLIQHASTLLKEIRSIESDFSGFAAEAFRDTDFLELYEAPTDTGRVNLDTKVPLPNNLEFNDWFTPFNRNNPVNPFIYEDWETERAGLNFFR